MGLLIGAAVLLFGYGTAYVASDEVRYLSRAGIEETRLLAGRTPIAIVARDSTEPDSVRAMAGLVVEVRTYAARLGLEAKETYTTYTKVGRDTLLLVLTASPKNCICPVTWNYPVTGRVPYKGYFNFAQARSKANDFAKMGYDVYLRPSAAFSTLGWFNDPLLSTALTRDSVELAALVFHELAHNTIWVKNATAFNESFAQWVAYSAARKFFLDRGDTAAANRADDRWHDEMVLDLYYRQLIGKLDSLYSQHLSPEANDTGRGLVVAWTREVMAGPLGKSLRVARPEWYSGRPINNAALIGVRLYRTNLDVFNAWGVIYRGDLFMALHELKSTLADVSDEEGAFRRMRTVISAQGGDKLLSEDR